MYMKVDNIDGIDLSPVMKEPMLESECRSWKLGAGMFLWSSTLSTCLLMFEENGQYTSYDITEEKGVVEQLKGKSLRVA